MKSKYFYHKKCDFCGFKNYKVKYNFTLQNMVICNNCHLVFLDTQRTDLLNLYDKDYFSENNSKTDANYFDYSDQKKAIKKNFLFAYKYILKQKYARKNLLEIGPGYGYFLEFLPKSIIKEAVEVSKIAASKIDNKKVLVYNDDFMKIKLTKKYNYIVAFDVIEHQIDLLKFLNKVNEYLKKDGVFVFTTPDFDTVFNKFFGKKSPTVQLNYHNYYFNKKWLLRQLPKVGFSIVEIKTNYYTHISIGQIFLLASFTFPIINRLKIINILKILKIDKIVIPFIRFGGIECIVMKK